MKKVISVSLYIIIFLLIAVICVISIKKFFDVKKVKSLNNIVAINYISSFISYNKIETQELIVKNVSLQVEKKENLQEDINEEISLKKETVTKQTKEEKKEDAAVENTTEKPIDENNDISTDILFDGLTEEQLINKLEKSLKNELSGTGVNFVSYYKSTGLDPYLAVAIVLHETGCSWGCSNLVKQCYNYGGMKGGEIKYKNTNYTCYSSKEAGITAYLNMLYNNYYSNGLTTPELINPKYAESLAWATSINKYIDNIKNN